MSGDWGAGGEFASGGASHALGGQQGVGTTERATPAVTRWELKPLEFDWTCVACDRVLDWDTPAWHDPLTHKVLCTMCRPASTVSQTGGAASAPKRPTAVQKSEPTPTDHRMEQILRASLTCGEVILTNRRGSKPNDHIDFVVVAPSGVWVIDAKRWNGKITFKTTDFTEKKQTLFVGPRNRTRRIQEIYGNLRPVANLINDVNVPIRAVAVFVEGDWDYKVASEFRKGKLIQYEGVWLSPTLTISAKIKLPGPLDAEAVQRIGKLLDKGLLPG